MDFLSDFVQNVFGKELTAGYATLFLVFVIICVGFTAWAIYYATYKGALSELARVSWLSMKGTIVYTSITVGVIVVLSLVLFAYDSGLNELVNIVIENAS